MSDSFTLPPVSRRESRRDLPVDKLPPGDLLNRVSAPSQQQRSVQAATAQKAEPARASAEPARPQERPAPMPQGFLYETEHPVLPIPFKATLGEHKLNGVELSVTAAYVEIDGELDPAWLGHKEVVRLQFDFAGFSITLFPELVVTGSREPGEMTLQFMDPAGAHLPQLRYIMNSYIAGDFASLGGLLSYTGPTTPKAAKSAEATGSKARIRSIAVAVMSMSMLVASFGFLVNRFTQSYELRPVFIERTGKDMKATTPGQVVYLNPKAKSGEVVFSINANSGDVLNFQLPCNCEVTVTEGIYEGATVLPIDTILSFFESTFDVRVQTQMSVEGLVKAMNGERAYLDMNDGRTIPVRVVITSATNAAALRGDPFVPVQLVPTDGALGKDDVGRSAQLRLSKSWFGASFANASEKP